MGDGSHFLILSFDIKCATFPEPRTDPVIQIDNVIIEDNSGGGGCELAATDIAGDTSTMTTTPK